MGSGFKREWRDSCTGNHSDWKHMFWDKAAALGFLGAHYPWFISTFLSYPKVVLQGARPGCTAHSASQHEQFQTALRACSCRWPLYACMPDTSRRSIVPFTAQVMHVFSANSRIFISCQQNT